MKIEDPYSILYAEFWWQGTTHKRGIICYTNSNRASDCGIAMAAVLGHSIDLFTVPNGNGKADKANGENGNHTNRP